STHTLVTVTNHYSVHHSRSRASTRAISGTRISWSPRTPRAVRTHLPSCRWSIDSSVASIRGWHDSMFQWTTRARPEPISLRRRGHPPCAQRPVPSLRHPCENQRATELHTTRPLKAVTDGDTDHSTHALGRAEHHLL